MVRLLQAEFIKLKGAPMLWVSVLGIAAAPGLNWLMRLANANYMRTWFSFMNQSIALVAMLLGAMLFGLVTAYLFGREYSEDTLKSLLTAPVRRSEVVLAKLLILLVWSLMLAAVAWVVSLGLGATFIREGLSGEIALRTLGWSVQTVLLVYATLPFVAWITMLARGYFPAIGFAVVAAMAGLIAAMSDKWGYLLPWSIPTVFALSQRPDNPVHPLGATSWVIMGALFVLGVILCLAQMRYADVDK